MKYQGSGARGQGPGARDRGTKERAGALRFLLIFTLVSGCGYQLVGKREVVPGGIVSISVGQFENHSREFDLDEKLTLALEREFYRRGVVRLEEERGSGEAELKGAIRSFRTHPVTFDASDEALQYEIELTIDAIVERRSDGEVLWRGAGIYAVDTYSVRTDTLVPSSSRFQRDKLTFSALDDLTPIQLAETERRRAIDRMLQSVVRDVHDRMLDDF